MEILETKFKADRFYIVVRDDDCRQTTLPRANFVWLQGNPSFQKIPKGYVIHHLDYDKTNDDISNLALMYKFHHVAHHWKQKKDISKVDINDKELPEDLTQYAPIKMPTIYFHQPANRFFVRIRQKNEQKV